MRKNTYRFAALAIFVAAAACSDNTGPATSIDATDAADIALDTDLLAGEIIYDQMFTGFAEAGLSANSADEKSFDRSRNCPAGGTVTLSGTVTRTRDDEGTTFDVSATGAWNDCARRGRRGITRTLNGTFTLTAHREIVNGQHNGQQTTTKAGSFTWTSSDGRSGQCDFDITSTRYPDERRRTVQGTVCGHTIDRTVDWNRQG